MKYSVNGEPRIGSAMGLYTTIMILLMTAYTLIICAVVKDSKTSNITSETLQNCIEENEMLWTYIENVDTCISLEDAIARRDSMLYQMQFLDE